MTDASADDCVRFSMKSLMLLITIMCVVLALPGGYVLLAVACIWLVLVAAVASLLIVFSKTINRWLAGPLNSRHLEQATNDAANR